MVSPADARDASDDQRDREWWKRRDEAEFQDTEADIWAAQQETQP